MTPQDERSVVEACRRYEKAWLSGENPSIDDHLADVPDALHETIREELLVVATELEASQPATAVYERLGGYRIIREIGRGGMARVYEAIQESLGRRVALKVLMMPSTHEEGIQRFRQEAQVAAKMHHSNIVAVYGVGEEEGVHYLAMELIEGCGLEHAFPGRTASRHQTG